MSSGRRTLNPGWRRLWAAMLDLPVILGWAVAAGLAGLGLRALGVVVETPGGWDALAFATLVLPVIVTMAVAEASWWQGSPGKRRGGFRVVDRNGRRITLVRSLARSGVKFAPWQMAHTAVFHLLADSRSPGWVALSVLAQVLVLGSVLMMFADGRHRSLHDLVTGTEVVDREPGVGR